jgi:hypothetical protein
MLIRYHRPEAGASGGPLHPSESAIEMNFQKNTMFVIALMSVGSYPRAAKELNALASSFSQPSMQVDPPWASTSLSYSA